MKNRFMTARTRIRLMEQANSLRDKCSQTAYSLSDVTNPVGNNPTLSLRSRHTIEISAYRNGDALHGYPRVELTIAEALTLLDLLRKLKLEQLLSADQLLLLENKGIIPKSRSKK